MSLCTLCDQPLLSKNLAVFECGHQFHLTCVLSCPHSSLCSKCTHVHELLPNIGTDRQVAMSADIVARLEQKSLKPARKWSVIERIARAVTPLTPKAQSFRDHMLHNKKLSKIREYGFVADDAVKERIRWSEICSKYKSKDIIDFGFTWNHMVEMGIVPTELGKFSWNQQQHKLQLDAQKNVTNEIDHYGIGGGALYNTSTGRIRILVVCFGTNGRECRYLDAVRI